MSTQCIYLPKVRTLSELPPPEWGTGFPLSRCMVVGQSTELGPVPTQINISCWSDPPHTHTHTLRFIMKRHATVNKLFINICLCLCFCELTHSTTSWLSLLCDGDICLMWHHHCCIWNTSISLTPLTSFITIRITKNGHLVNVNCELQISQHGGGGA